MKKKEVVKTEKKKGGKKKKSMLPIIFLFMIGVSVMGYPFFADFYNQAQYKKVNVEFDKGAKKLDKSEVDRRIKLAEYYNDSMVRPNIKDPFVKKNHEKGIREYARMLQVKETMGYVEIPKINQTLPIYPGTSDEVLEKGVGHMEFTSLPIGGKGTHCVLTAHSGIPTAKLFTDLDKMQKGDVFFIRNIKEVLAYKVDNIQVITPTNFKPLRYFPGEDYCTLLTCTPYTINTHRLLVRGERTDYNEAMKKVKKKNIKLYIIIAAIVLLLIILLMILRKRKKKKIKNKVNTQ